MLLPNLDTHKSFLIIRLSSLGDILLTTPALRCLRVAYPDARIDVVVRQRYAELLQDNIAVNMLAPSTAIRTPGASDLIPEDYPSERIEYIVETGLALCHRPPRERTGLCAYSLHFPLAHGLHGYTLDGRERIEDPVIPPYAHPGIVASGEGN